MDPRRFDRVATALAGRLTRRTALTAGSGGLAASLLGLAGRRSAPRAQDAASGASPGASAVASPAATPAALTAPQLLFVQTFAGGTWAPKPDEPGAYLLTLTGHAAQTVYFSDRPGRLVGTVSTRDFLDRLGFTPADPPNAAVVAQTADGGEDVLVVELLNPVYAEGFGADGAVTVTYEARVLAGEAGERLASVAGRQGDQEFPAAFGPASLFIDAPTACSDGHVVCWRREYTVDLGWRTREKGRIGPMPFYWGFGDLCCHPSNQDERYWLDRCDAAIAACRNSCTTVSWTPCW